MGSLDPAFLQDLRNAVMDIIGFKEMILRLLIQYEIAPTLLPLLIDHITLLETARGLASMAEAAPETFNAAIRFTEDVIAATTELRDFKAAAHELLVLRRILSVISLPLPADHVRREADKFLSELNEVKK